MKEKIKKCSISTKCVILINIDTKEYCIGLTNGNVDKYARAVAKYYNFDFKKSCYYALDLFEFMCLNYRLDDIDTILYYAFEYCEQKLNFKQSLGYKYINCNKPLLKVKIRNYNLSEYSKEIKEMYPEEKLLFALYLEYPKRLIKKINGD